MNRTLRSILTFSLTLVVLAGAILSVSAGSRPGPEVTEGAAISGVVFLDHNRNGIQDDGEAGIESVRVDISDTASGGQVFQATTMTGSDGSYVFAGLSAGAYSVVETDFHYFESTTANSVDVNVAPNATATADFGDAATIVINGTVFNDLNQDGYFGLEEAPVVGALVEVYADTDGDGVYQYGESLVGSANTDDQGNWVIGYLTPGPQVVRVLQPGGNSAPKSTALTLSDDDASGNVSLAIGLSGGSPMKATALRRAGHPDAVADEVVVRFVEGMGPEAVTRLLQVEGLAIRQRIPDLNIYVVRVPVGRVADYVAWFSKLADVRWAEPNGIVQGELTPTDPDYGNVLRVYAPQKIDAGSAWDVTAGDPNLIVAVVDSGLSLTHPEFNGRIAEGMDFVNGDADPSDDQGHGTHVAGIIAAAMDNGLGSTGIAPRVRIMPIKALNYANSGTWANIAAGINYAVGHGASVINLSLGGTSISQSGRDAVNNALNNNVVVVAASGNNGTYTPFYPAALAGVLAVGSTDSTDTRVSTSDYGTWLDVVAPGDRIWSTYWRSSADPTTYEFLSGTSMASPHVAALAALIRSARPELGVADVRDIIQRSAVDLGTAGRDDYYGWGRIDAGAALALAQTWAAYTPTPTMAPTPTPLPTNTPTVAPTSTATPLPTPTPTRTPTPLTPPTNTPVPPTNTPVPPTNTPVPPTNTPVPPTNTPVPPTNTPVPPTNTPVPPTNTPVSPTNTPVSPTNTPVLPTNTATPLPTNTPTPGPGGLSTTTPAPTPTPLPTSTPTSLPTSTPTLPPTATPTMAPYVQRVNAGGKLFTDSASQGWAADKAFTAGTWGYVSGSAKSSTTAVNGTVDDALYQKYREGISEYRFTVPDGAYLVTLKFAEFGTTTIGDRLMKISIEGVDVETGLDVYKMVGKATALDRTYQTTVSDGLLNIVFAKVSGRKSPMVSAVEVVSAAPASTAPTPTWTPTITPGGPTLTPMPTATPTLTFAPYYSGWQVNAGGVAYTDATGTTWAADQPYNAGSWGYTGGTAKYTTKSVNGTVDDPLYQYWRENPGEYRFAVPNGTYQVTLRFAEFEVTKASSRLMKIMIEGVVVENALSVYGTVGSATALEKTYTTTVTDGVLNIAFAQNGGSKLPMVSAIRIQ